MIHYICIIVREEIGDVLQCVVEDRGCTPHTLMCSYTLTYCLCILIVYVYVLHLVVMFCCIVIIGVVHRAYNQRYCYISASAWRSDVAGRIVLYCYCLSVSEYIMDCDGYSFGGPSYLIC